MDLTVIVDPSGQQGQDGVGVREDNGCGIVPFQGFDEGLGHAIALRAANRGEEQLDAEGRGHFCRLPGDIGAAIIREPFQPVRDLEGLEAAFDSGDHQITDHLARDAGIGDSRPGDDLAIAGVDDENDPHHLSIAGMDLQMIGAPTDIGAQGNHNAVVGAGGPAAQSGIRDAFVKSLPIVGSVDQVSDLTPLLEDADLSQRMMGQLHP